MNFPVSPLTCQMSEMESLVGCKSHTKHMATQSHSMPLHDLWKQMDFWSVLYVKQRKALYWKYESKILICKGCMVNQF